MCRQKILCDKNEDYNEGYEGNEGNEGNEGYEGALFFDPNFNRQNPINIIESNFLVSTYENNFRNRQNYIQRHANQEILSYEIPIRFELTSNGREYKIFKQNSIDSDFTLEKADVELVASQSECNIEYAIRSLINNQYDLVNAIMDLTL